MTHRDESRREVQIHARIRWSVLATDADGRWFHGRLVDDDAVEQEMQFRTEADARKAWAIAQSANQ